MEKIICKHPFYSVQIQNTGDVYCCCTYWTDFYSFGNIFEQTFDEIWNGERAQKFRKQFIDNHYEYCKLNICDPYEAKDDFTPQLICDYPKQIEFSYDRRCNVRCIFCRNEMNAEEEKYNREKEKKIEDNFDRIFTSVIQRAEVIELNSAGELFASNHSMEIIRKSIKINPNIKFKIISNGILFTKDMINRLELENRMLNVTISIHAASEKTYNKLVERGNFRAVIDNVRYLSNLKKEGKLRTLQLNFVVNTFNYKEMKKFAQFAKEMGAVAFFINYHKQIESEALEKIFDITKPDNPKYNDLVRILRDPIFKEDFCFVNDYLRSLKPVKKPIFSLFKK